jgi:hypothetical protein
MSPNPDRPREQAAAFISYAREDKEFVLRLCEGLRAHGVEPVGDWLLTSGQKYEERLRELNLMAQAFVFVISPDSVTSAACRDELSLAVESRKQVLPVSRRDHGDDNLLDSALRAPQWTFLREGDDFEAGVENLVKAINTDFDLMDTHGDLLLAAKEWEENGRNKSYLLRKDGLKEAEVWLARTSAQPAKLPQPTPLVTEFILAAQGARSRGARIAFGVTLAVILSLSALTVWALLSAREAVRQRQTAEKNEQEALAQKRAAEENAQRAVEQGERRLMAATLLLNPEGYQFTRVLCIKSKFMFGVRPWALDDGSLNDILQKFYARDPERFVRVFGGGDPALAQRLLAYVASPEEERVPLTPLTEADWFLWEGWPAAVPEQARPGAARRGGAESPEGNLNREPWVTRFKLASQEPAFQAVQFEEYSPDHLGLLEELRQVAPEVKSERGLAFMLDMVIQHTLEVTKGLFKEARDEAPNQTEAELLRRVAALSVESVTLGPEEVEATRRRRQKFLDTPFFSDKELGF